jgi:SAM-dependent methyltransferase
MRRRLSGVRPLADVYYLTRELWWLASDRPDRLRAALDRDLGGRLDPWGYNTPDGRARLDDLEALLDRIGGPTLGDVLEVGCAEGHFTERLAPRSRSLLAVDLSPIALSRARTRCQWGPNVRFARWDLRRDPSPGTFDLVVATDVLEYLGAPRVIRAAVRKLLAATRPGGYLLIGGSRQSEHFERAWWGRTLLTGAMWIDEYVGGRRQLERVDGATEDAYVYGLFRKRE